MLVEWISEWEDGVSDDREICGLEVFTRVMDFEYLGYG